MHDRTLGNVKTENALVGLYSECELLRLRLRHCLAVILCCVNLLFVHGVGYVT